MGIKSYIMDRKSFKTVTVIFVIITFLYVSMAKLFTANNALLVEI